MRAVLPMHVPLVHQSNERFIDEGRCLKGVTGGFISHIAPRQSMQLLINNGHQPFARGLIAIAPGD